MTPIQKIKEELGKISPWPWEAQSDNETTISSVTGDLLTPVDAEFALHSPERIAALLEYFEAAETMTSLEGDFDTRADRLRNARAELEKEE